MRCDSSMPRSSAPPLTAAMPARAAPRPSSGRTLAGSPGTSKRRRHLSNAASRSSEIVASSKSRPLARCAAAEATTTATASCQARSRRLASERESQIKPTPKATVSTRAASGHPGGRTPWTISTRLAVSGVSAETIPSTPTTAAPQARSLSALGRRGITSRGYKRLMRESQEPLGVRIPLPRWVTPAAHSGRGRIGAVDAVPDLRAPLPACHVSLRPRLGRLRRRADRVVRRHRLGGVPRFPVARSTRGRHRDDARLRRVVRRRDLAERR